MSAQDLLPDDPPATASSGAFPNSTDKEDWERWWAAVSLDIRAFGTRLGFGLVILIVGWLLVGFVLAPLLRRLLKRRKTSSAVSNFVVTTTSALLKLLVLFTFIDMLGIETLSLTAMLAAIGVGIGVSLSSLMQNFIAGVVLISQEPFKLGDYLILSDKREGAVRKIGLTHSELEMPHFQACIVPNSYLTSSNVVNYDKVPLTRVECYIMLRHTENLRLVKQLFLEVCAADDRILAFPKPDCRIDQMTLDGIRLAFLPWVRSPDYWDVYFDIRWKMQESFLRYGVQFQIKRFEMEKTEVPQPRSAKVGSTRLRQRSRDSDQAKMPTPFHAIDDDDSDNSETVRFPMRPTLRKRSRASRAPLRATSPPPSTINRPESFVDLVDSSDDATTSERRTNLQHRRVRIQPVAERLATVRPFKRLNAPDWYARFRRLSNIADLVALRSENDGSINNDSDVRPGEPSDSISDDLEQVVDLFKQDVLQKPPRHRSFPEDSQVMRRRRRLAADWNDGFSSDDTAPSKRRVLPNRSRVVTVANPGKLAKAAFRPPKTDPSSRSVRFKRETQPPVEPPVAENLNGLPVDDDDNEFMSTEDQYDDESDETVIPTVGERRRQDYRTVQSVPKAERERLAELERQFDMLVEEVTDVKNQHERPKSMLFTTRKAMRRMRRRLMRRRRSMADESSVTGSKAVEKKIFGGKIALSTTVAQNEQARQRTLEERQSRRTSGPKESSTRQPSGRRATSARNTNPQTATNANNTNASTTTTAGVAGSRNNSVSSARTNSNRSRAESYSGLPAQRTLSNKLQRLQAQHMQQEQSRRRGRALAPMTPLANSAEIPMVTFRQDDNDFESHSTDDSATMTV